MLEVHVFSSGDIFTQMVQTVALFVSVNQSDLNNLVIMLSVPATTLVYLQTKSYKAITAWATVLVLVPSFAINSKADLQIIDSSDPMSTYSVSNVPNIIAVPAYFSTYVMFQITTAMESIFHTNDDESYNRTGMVFGAELFVQGSQATSLSSTTTNGWNNFIDSCIRPDITINHKYTYNDLTSSTDIFKFLGSKSMSPARGVFIEEEYKTCAEALPILEKQFEDDTNDWFTTLTSKLTSNRSNYATDSALTKTAMNNVSQNIMGLSKTSTEFTKQLMVINATKRGIASLDEIGMAQNYMEAQTEAQSLSAMTSASLWAKKKIPMLHSILLMMIIFSAPIVVALAMLPTSSMKLITNYIYGYFYLASWSLFFVGANYISTLYLKSAMARLVDVNGGISMENLDNATMIALDASSIAGWLCSITPFASIYFVRGGASIMSSASMQFAGMMNGASGQIASSMANGNIRLGETGYNVHNHDMESANKHDTDYMHKTAGNITQTDRDGITTHQTANGDQYISTPKHNLPFSINNNDAITKSLSKAVTEQTDVVDSTKASMDQAVSGTATMLQGQSDAVNSNKGYNFGTNHVDSAGMRKDLSEMNEVVEAYSSKHGVNKEDVWNKMTTASMSGSFGFGIPLTKINGSITASETITDGERNTESESETTSEDRRLMEKFSQAFDSYEQNSESVSTSDGASKTSSRQSSENTQISVARKAVNAHDVAVSERDTLAYNLNQARNDTLSINENLDNEFVEYVQTHEKEFGETGLNANQVITGQNETARGLRADYADKFLRDEYDGDYGEDARERLTDVNKENLKLKGKNEQQEIINKGVDNAYEQFTEGAETLQLKKKSDIYDEGEFRKNKYETSRAVQTATNDIIKEEEKVDDTLPTIDTTPPYGRGIKKGDNVQNLIEEFNADPDNEVKPVYQYTEEIVTPYGTGAEKDASQAEAKTNNKQTDNPNA